VIEIQNVTVTHTNFRTELCEWNMWYSFRTSLYLTRTLKQDIVHNWHVIEFQIVTKSHTYNEAEYFTWSDVRYIFRTSQYLTRNLKQNIVHGVTNSKFHYISQVNSNRIMQMEWYVMQFQKVIIPHTNFETGYLTWTDM